MRRPRRDGGEPSELESLATARLLGVDAPARRPRRAGVRRRDHGDRRLPAATDPGDRVPVRVRRRRAGPWRRAGRAARDGGRSHRLRAVRRAGSRSVVDLPGHVRQPVSAPPAHAGRLDVRLSGDRAQRGRVRRRRPRRAESSNPPTCPTRRWRSSSRAATARPTNWPPSRASASAARRRGWERIEAVASWVNEHLTFRYGSSSPTKDAPPMPTATAPVCVATSPT